MTALHEHTASELAALIRTSVVSSREVVEAHLARIDSVNPRVNAITVMLADTALAAADQADRARSAGAALPPLHGVPFTAKENLDCLGTPTTHGVRALSHSMPYLDAPIVARMKAAGAILIARTNLSEMGLRLDTDNPLRGHTLNPFDPQRTPGGSSGGDAVAVATGMTPIGLGTDMGGSLRVPAHCCGVAALKPTTGRIPHAASLPPQDYGMAGLAMLAPGPIARSIADLDVCLSVVHGRDPRDPRSVDVSLKGPPPEERRAAIVTELPGITLPASMVSAILRAGDLLAAQGWIIEEATPPEIQRVGELWHKLVATDLSAVMPLVQPIVSTALYDHVMRLCAAAKIHEISNNRLHEERSRLMRAWSGFFSEYPVLVGPNLSCAPWMLDADLNAATGLTLIERATQFVLPGNALALPVVAVPMGVADGLPGSIQVYADLWREDMCLEAASIIEQGNERVVPIEPRAVG